MFESPRCNYVFYTRQRAPDGKTGLAQPYWFKIANFPTHPLSFSALAQGDPFRIYGKASQILKLESYSRWWRFGDPSLHRFGMIHLCDRQTDRQTDRIAMAKTCWKQ